MAGYIALPSSHRAAQRFANSPPPRRVARRENRDYGCRIKGNHSRKGEFIYHVPGQRYYEQTRPEAMFCSEAQARAAGYRPSKV